MGPVNKRCGDTKVVPCRATIFCTDANNTRYHQVNIFFFRTMNLIDSHTHLEMPEYQADREDVIQRAQNQGIKKIITIGIGITECKKAINLAQTHSCIFAAIGIHPHNAKDMDAETLDFLKTNAQKDKVVAIGEIGLDLYRNLSPQRVQIQCFLEQLTLSRQLKLPVIIHSRQAYQKTIDILRQENVWEMCGVVHCFSGDYKVASACLDLGLYLSFAGTITFKNAVVLQDVVKRVPLERILIETDAPFLAPVPVRGKRNEPGYVRFVAEKIAELKHIPPEKVARVTANNTKTLFSLP